METVEILLAGLTAIILFVFGLDHFSKEIEKVSGEKFRKSLSKATRIPVFGVLIGAIVTAIIQSSSATSVITISLVNAGIISFKNSVGIIFGSNIGTTITAQLVAFKLTAFAPLFIIVGFVLSLVRNRYSIFGKAIFYFGFVFFTLNLISSTLQPLQNNEFLISLLTQPQNPLLAILFGCLFTAVVQSSSVTTGLAIIFTQQGLLSLDNAVPLIMGANIGTTATALIAVFNMDIAAKKTALSHFLFNVGGVALFTPFLFMSGDYLRNIEVDPAVALATIHLVFNVVTSVIFLAFVSPFARFVDAILGEGKMDFMRLPLPSMPEEMNFKTVQSELSENMSTLLSFLQENYNSVTLSIETNYKTIQDAAEKRIEYIGFIKKEYLNYFSQLVVKVTEEADTRELLRLINQFDYLFQIHDSIKDLFETRTMMSAHFIELRSDMLLLVREISSHTLGLFDDVHKYLDGDELDVKAKSRTVQIKLDHLHKEMLTFLADPARQDAGALTNFSTYSQRLKDKLINLAFIQRERLQLEDNAAKLADKN